MGDRKILALYLRWSIFQGFLTLIVALLQKLKSLCSVGYIKNAVDLLGFLKVAALIVGRLIKPSYR